MVTEEINLTVEGINLKGWVHFLPEGSLHKNNETPMLILCHGIPRKKNNNESGDDSDRGYFGLAESCVKKGFSTFHFNFRGAGESEGNFDLEGWTRDLSAFLDYLEESGYSHGKGFYLWGFSAGAAVCTYTASQDTRIKAAVLAACPAEFKTVFPMQNVKEIIERFRDTGIIKDLDFPSDSLQWLEKIHNLSPLRYVGEITPTPVLIVHGTEDEVIPSFHAYNLFQNAVEPKELFIIPGAQHQLRRNNECISKSLEWLLGLN